VRARRFVLDDSADPALSSAAASASRTRQGAAWIARAMVAEEAPAGECLRTTDVVVSVLHIWRQRNTLASVKTLTVRLPEDLVARIEAESRARKLSKSDVVRERLSLGPRSRRRRPAPLEAIADLVGSVDGLPADLSARRKGYLAASGYGQKRRR